MARPNERETRQYHCSLRLFTVVKRSTCDPIACWILARTSSLVTWSLHEMRRGKDNGERKAEENIAATTPSLQQQGQFLPTVQRGSSDNSEQLKTGHSRLGHHMFTEFRIGESSACYCGTSPMTVEHFLQDGQNHQNPRAETWPADTSVREKVYDPVENLRRTAAYVRATGVPV